MRIVHVVTRLLRAGSEENTLTTAAGQIADGHEVTLVHGHEAMPDLARQKVPGLHLVCAPSLTREIAPKLDLAAYGELRRLFETLSPDVVHTHQSKAGIVGRWAAVRARVPLIVHGVHIIPYIDGGRVKRGVYLAAERATARVTDGFIHVSEGMRRISRDHRVGEGRAHAVVPSGFDLARFETATPPPAGDPVWGADGPDHSDFTLVMLASFEPRKGHVALLRRLADLLSRDAPRTRLVLAGEGPERARIESTIAELGLRDRVILTGFRTDPERIVAMADACLHCSTLEGLPRSVLQYIAAGKPVAMFDLPGLDEVLTDGTNGFAVPQGDWDALLDRVRALATDPELRARIAAGAKATDLSSWNADLMAGRTTAIYEDLLRAKAARGPAVA